LLNEYVIVTVKSRHRKHNGEVIKAAEAAFIVLLLVLLQLHAVFLTELVNAARSVKNLLLTGIERVALGANFNAQRLVSG
jgi:hypothetical protein